MDLDYLLRREGEERLRADKAACDAASEAHLAIAGIFGKRIEERRRALHAEPGLRADAPLPRL